jgi:hypothetical protein
LFLLEKNLNKRMKKNDVLTQTEGDFVKIDRPIKTDAEKLASDYAATVKQFPPQKRHVNDHDRAAWVAAHAKQMS